MAYLLLALLPKDNDDTFIVFIVFGGFMLSEQEQVYMGVWVGIDGLLDVVEWDAATRVGEREAQQELWRLAKERKCNENITRYLMGIPKGG